MCGGLFKIFMEWNGMRSNFRLIFRLIPLLLGFFLQIAAAETIQIGAEDSWPPFSRKDGTGLTNTIVKEAYASQGVDVEFVIAPYSRLLREVKTGRLMALFNVTREESTQQTFLFGEHKLFTATTAYYHHKNRPLNASNFREVNHGEKIGMILGYEYGPFILSNRDIASIRVKYQSQLVKMLLKNRLDGALMFDAIADDIFKTIKNSEKIVRAFDGQHSDIYVAFSRRFPGAEKYMNLLDKGLMQIRKNGQLSRILDGKAVP